MLKSKFDLSTKRDEIDEQVKETSTHDEEHEAEEVDEPMIVDEERPVVIHRPIDVNEIKQRLQFLGKTGEGDGYTYLKLDISKMGLTDLTMVKRFKHLQFIDVSDNLLKLRQLEVLMDLPYLVLIQADGNQLQSAALTPGKYLQVLILNRNYISTVEDVYQPELSTLEIGFNKIQKIFFKNRMPHIKVLDFRYNIIMDVLDLDFPNLDSLYLAGNKIKNLSGIEKLTNLRVLHVRHNPIKNLDGLDEGLTKLTYVNLRNCKIRTLKQIKKLRALPALETLILKGCPYMGGTGQEGGEAAAEEEDPELRVEVLATLPRVKRLNKSIVSPEERGEAKELMMQWLEEGEKEDEEDMEEEGMGEEHSMNED